MTLLLPLGLLGLVSLAALLIIYILRPNYQQKLVSSTYIWKLSFKYRKKRIPVSKLRNILILIFQLLLLICLTLLIARPALVTAAQTSDNEVVAIIDASAGMRAVHGGKSRYARAVEEAGTLARTTLDAADGVFSVILADDEAHFADGLSRLEAEDKDELDEHLLALSETQCGYGAADIEGAAELARQVLALNPKAQVLLYTATEYLDTGAFRVVDMRTEGEWNAAILDAAPVLSDNNVYTFTVDAACYGAARPVTVYCTLYGVNGNAAATLRASKTEYFTDLEPEKTIEFAAADFNGSGAAIVSFDSMNVAVDEEDSFQDDNTFNVYGGTRPTLKVQYASSAHENFIWTVLYRLRSNKSKHWNIEITQSSPDNAATSGFDFYIFEHTMPAVLPTDGAVLLVDPNASPEGSGLSLGSLVDVSTDNVLLTLGETHPVTRYIDPSFIPNIITQYRAILPSEGYSELLYLNGDPILLVRKEAQLKAAVLALNFELADFSVVPAFPLMMYNLFDYFFPVTLSGHAFEVGETVTVNARGEDLKIFLPNSETVTPDLLPAQYLAQQPGNYTVTQTDMRGATVVDQFYVHIPAAESNLFRTEERLPAIYSDDAAQEGVRELAIWFACAALILLVTEWFLHARENL